jgi:hypothetical protein
MALPGTQNNLRLAASGGGSLSGGAEVWDLGSLPAGASGQRQVTLRAAIDVVDGTLLSTTAELYNPGTQQSYVRATSVSAVTTPRPDAGLLAIATSAAPDPVHPGQSLLYTITVSNIGGAASGYFFVSIPIPGYSTASVESASPGLYTWTCTSTSTNGCGPGQVVTWYYSSGLAAGAKTTFKLPVTIDAPPNATLLTTAAQLFTDSGNGGGNAPAAVLATK